MIDVVGWFTTRAAPPAAAGSSPSTPTASTDTRQPARAARQPVHAQRQHDHRVTRAGPVGVPDRRAGVGRGAVDRRDRRRPASAASSAPTRPAARTPARRTSTSCSGDVRANTVVVPLGTDNGVNLETLERRRRRRRGGGLLHVVGAPAAHRRACSRSSPRPHRRHPHQPRVLPARHPHTGHDRHRRRRLGGAAERHGHEHDARRAGWPPTRPGPPPRRSRR